MAQLGARFHGMEEVIGSIPIRSTNKPIKMNSFQTRTLFERAKGVVSFIMKARPSSEGFCCFCWLYVAWRVRVARWLRHFRAILSATAPRNYGYERTGRSRPGTVVAIDA